MCTLSFFEISQREVTEQRIERIDHLFEVGLVLITVLSASLLQYLSSKYSFDSTLNNAEKLKDLSFVFKELTWNVALSTVNNVRSIKPFNKEERAMTTDTQNEEEYGYCSYCHRKVPKSELDLNDGLCENCATQMDDDMDEEG